MESLAPTYVNHTVRAGQTIESHLNGIMHELADIFVGRNPGKTHEDFYKEIVDAILANLPKFEGDTERADLIFKNINIASPYIDIYKNSLLYCLSAKMEFVAGKIEYAWSLVAESNYQLGCLFATGNVRRNFELVETGVKKKFSQAGGQRKAEKNDPLREIVYEIAVKDVPSSGKWKTLNNMSHLIYKRLLVEAPKRGVKVSLSEDRGPETVKDWLKVMPGIETFVDLPNTKKKTPQA